MRSLPVLVQHTQVKVSLPVSYQQERQPPKLPGKFLPTKRSHSSLAGTAKTAVNSTKNSFFILLPPFLSTLARLFIRQPTNQNSPSESRL